MNTANWLWSLVFKSTVALAGFSVLWRLSPNIAAGLGMLVGLCFVAYWHENPKAQRANEDFTLDFERRLALAEEAHISSTRN